MRISDWSSDVCSSDLSRGLLAMNYEYPDFNILMADDYDPAAASADQKAIALSAVGIGVRSEERRVGKECVRVDLGGRRIIKKKKIINDTSLKRLLRTQLYA